MIETWPAKSPTEAKDYTWLPPIAREDALATVAVAVASGTVTATAEIVANHKAVVTVSGGAAGEEARLTVTAVSDGGETLVGSFLVPVRAVSPAYTHTARDICSAALRKIVGLGRTPRAAELEYALESLNDMLAAWRLEGIDCGIAGQLAAYDALTVPEEYLAAIKHGLTVWLADQFGRELTPGLVMLARETKRALLVARFTFAPLTFEAGLTQPRPMRSINDL